MTLVEFLLARLDEDEHTARAVQDRSAPWHGQWVADRGGGAVRTYNGHVLAYGHATLLGRALLKPGFAEHVARHDPARVMAEVEAKRRIIEWHCGDRDGRCLCCQVEEAGTCQTLRLLALPYADLPGYRAAWRP